MVSNKEKRKLKILVIGAHPADVFDNAGGTCLHHIRQGDSVTAAIITHGARIHDVVISDQMKNRDRIPQGDELEALIKERRAVKEKEVRDACAVMGIEDVRFVECDDDDYIKLVNKEMICCLARLIREVRPNIIITHSPYDSGGIADQHATVGHCVVQASWVANTVDPDDTHSPYRVAQLFFMGFPSSFISNHFFSQFNHHCQIYIDVSDVAHLKCKALDMMKSQQYDGDIAFKRLEAVEGSAGAAVKVAYAEPFMVAQPEVYDTLPVSDYRLNTANETEKETNNRMGFILTKYGSLDNYHKILKEKEQE